MIELDNGWHVCKFASLQCRMLVGCNHDIYSFINFSCPEELLAEWGIFRRRQKTLSNCYKHFIHLTLKFSKWGHWVPFHITMTHPRDFVISFMYDVYIVNLTWDFYFFYWERIKWKLLQLCRIWFMNEYILA